MDAEETLEAVLYDGYQRAGHEVGYWGTRFLQSLRRHGGLATAKKLLNSSGVSAGFEALSDARRLDLAVESVVLREEFSHLFTADELAEARRRLEGNAQIPRTRTRVPVELVFPNELPVGRAYNEGAVRQVVTNVYERDPAARNACLQKHGIRCKVCGLDFEKRYGRIGSGFIHVHHKKPLGTMRRTYKLDPVKDLVPVCPNCHAMLHTSDPPLSVKELKECLK